MRGHRSVAKREKLVSARQRRGASQQDVLDVVELEHRDLSCLADLAVSDRQIHASQRLLAMPLSASLHLVEHARERGLHPSAFLISSALTYGYSPYSRKLGH